MLSFWFLKKEDQMSDDEAECGVSAKRPVITVSQIYKNSLQETDPNQQSKIRTFGPRNKP